MPCAATRIVARTSRVARRMGARRIRAWSTSRLKCLPGGERVTRGRREQRAERLHGGTRFLDRTLDVVCGCLVAHREPNSALRVLGAQPEREQHVARRRNTGMARAPIG